MKITMSFEGRISGSVTVDVTQPTRWTFAKIASALWRNYRDICRAVDLKALGNPDDIHISGSFSHHLGNKIQAIKAVREVTGLGLREAKDVVDSLTSDTPKTIQISIPDRRAALLRLRESGFTAQ